MPFIIGPTLEPPGPGALALGSVTGDLDFVLRHATRYERAVVLQLVQLQRGLHRWVEFKIRCRDLVPDQPACPNPNWHIDTVPMLDHPARHEVHHLFTTPPGTRFLYAWESCGASAPASISAPPYTIVSYGRVAWHRGPRAPDWCRRLMIRMSETDVVAPRRESDRE